GALYLINQRRLWEEIHKTSCFGLLPLKQCMNRLSLSVGDKPVQDYLCIEASSLGLQVRTDEMGNIFAIRPGRNNVMPPIGTWSHLDTQSDGDRFDGILGVLAGLEVLRTMKENDIQTYAPVTNINSANDTWLGQLYKIYSQYAEATLEKFESAIDAMENLLKAENSGLDFQTESTWHSPAVDLDPATIKCTQDAAGDAIGAGQVMEMDANCVTTIIPVVTDRFNSLNDVGWYGAPFLLASASSQLFYGKLSFVVGRAISSLGSAGILAGTNIIISRCVLVRMRPNYSSIIGAIECVAILIGPLLGGAIAETLGWRWCFWLLLPLAGLTIVITILFLGNEEAIKVDSEGQNTPPQLTLTLFLPTIKREEATVPTKIFLTKTILFKALYSFNTSKALYVILPIWFQAVKRASLFSSGVRGLPLVLSLVVSILTSGSVTSIIGYYTPKLCLGFILMAIGAGMLTPLHVETSMSL
ncbi:LOW QUALITY PROTEIN: hypothetical protein MKX08_007958, partial [Trichoderma sp. CBMAI-0020]